MIQLQFTTAEHVKPMVDNVEHRHWFLAQVSPTGCTVLFIARNWYNVAQYLIWAVLLTGKPVQCGAVSDMSSSSYRQISTVWRSIWYEQFFLQANQYSVAQYLTWAVLLTGKPVQCGAVSDMSSSSYRQIIHGLGFSVCFCVFTRVSLLVLGLAFCFFVYFLFVFVWLSVPVQSIVWKDSSPKWPDVSSEALNPMHSLTLHASHLEFFCPLCGHTMLAEFIYVLCLKDLLLVIILT